MSSALGKSIQRAKRQARTHKATTSSGAAERWGEERVAQLEAEDLQAQRTAREKEGGGQLKSIWECNALEDLLTNADARERGYEAERDTKVVWGSRHQIIGGGGGRDKVSAPLVRVRRFKWTPGQTGWLEMEEMRNALRAREGEGAAVDSQPHDGHPGTTPAGASSSFLTRTMKSTGMTAAVKNISKSEKGSMEWWMHLHAALTVPKRPVWDHTMTAQEVQDTEKKAFVDWRRTLSRIEDECDVVMTPYEKNLEVWRQLWRVVERSDIVLELVDARNPLVYRCPDFEKYVTQTPHPRTPQKGKPLILLLNKADLLTESQRRAWAEYFQANGDVFFFFSAKPSSKEDSMPSTEGKAKKMNGENDGENDEDSEDDEDSEEADSSLRVGPQEEGTTGEMQSRRAAHKLRHKKKKLRAPVRVATDPYALAAARQEWKEKSKFPAPKTPARLTEEEVHRNQRLQAYVVKHGVSPPEEEMEKRDAVTPPKTAGHSSKTAEDMPGTTASTSPSLPAEKIAATPKKVVFTMPPPLPATSSAGASPTPGSAPPPPPSSTRMETPDGPVVLPIELWTVLTPLQLLDQLSLFRPLCGLPLEAHTGDSLMVGLVGYPNVGKSSTINAIIGAKKVTVSITPGKTKHFQTLPIPNEQRIMLCDCPGLVFPSFATTKWEMLCDGILAADHTTDATEAISVVCRRIPRCLLELRFHLSLHRSDRAGDRSEGEEEMQGSLAERLLRAYAMHRGYEASHGRLDLNRAGKELLKLYVDGGLVYACPPPTYKPKSRTLDIRGELKKGGRTDPEGRQLSTSAFVMKRHQGQHFPKYQNDEQEKKKNENNAEHEGPSKSEEGGEEENEEWEDMRMEENEDGREDTPSWCTEEVEAWKDLDAAARERGLSDADEDDDDNDAARSEDSEIHDEEALALLPFFFARPPHVAPHTITRSEAFNWEANLARVEALVKMREKEEAYRRARRKPLHGQLVTDVPDISTFINRHGEVELRLDDDDCVIEIAKAALPGPPAPVIVEKKLTKRQQRRQEKKSVPKGALKVSSFS